MGPKYDFLNFLEKLIVTFFLIVVINEVSFATFLHKSNIWEKSRSLDMGRCYWSIALRNFQSAISLEQNDEIVSFLYVHTNSW